MRIIYFKKDEKHVLGRAGENGATRITVDVAAWAAEYPSGTGALIYKRPDGQVYPLTTALDGGQLYAALTSVDTAISGVCRVEAQWLDGDVVVKSRVYEGSVAPSLGAAGSVPEASPSWVDDMTALGAAVGVDAAQVAADKATVAADKADAQAAQIAAAQSATEASGSATAAQQTAAQIVTDEDARVTAEQGRVSAEQTRVSAEQARVSAENTRVSTEATRQASLLAAVNNASASATSAGNSATAAAASEASVDSMVDTIAKQTIAERMLTVLQQEAVYLQTIAENGGTGGNLNGFSLNLDSDAVVLSYTNPTDGTDTRSATFPTKTTGELIVAELAAINATLRTMVPNTNA